MASIQELFEEKVGSVMLRQQAFAEFLSEHNFKLLLDEGKIDFGEKGIFPIQLLGTVSDEEQSWLWAWANGEIKPELKSHVESIRLIGEQKDLLELTEEEVFFDEADPEILAIIAVDEKSCYYRVNHTSGNVYAMVIGAPIPSRGNYGFDSINRVIELISQAFTANLKRVTLTLLTQEGFNVTKKDEGFIAKRGEEPTIKIVFDENGDILEMVEEI